VKNRLKRSVRSYTKMAEFVWKHTMNGIRRGLIVSQGAFCQTLLYRCFLQRCTEEGVRVLT
jgi:hypothetical protein